MIQLMQSYVRTRKDKVKTARRRLRAKIRRWRGHAITTRRRKGARSHG